jgi:hypothetical protein
MCRIIKIYILFFLATFTQLNAMPRFTYFVSSAKDLDTLFSVWHDSINVILKPGDYHLTPKREIDTDIVSRNGKAVPVYYTYGLKIMARYVKISGPPKFAAMIFTNAGYGLFFLNCEHAEVDGLIITSGRRDSDSMATDAAIVIKNSTVYINNNLIFDNIGDSAMLAITNQGIMGICVREGSHAYIVKNQIARNTYNGISVYRDAAAMISDNVIDGVDSYNESLSSLRFYKREPENLKDGGRGTGIFFTRNSKGIVKSNIIKRYRSGVGIFVNANVELKENIIENIKTWGICIWDADTGRPVARIERNVIFKTGACGIGVIRYLEPKKEDPGFLVNNIIVETAQDSRFDAPDKFCYQCALAVHGAPDKFIIQNNIFYQNRWLSPCSSDSDMMLPQFVNMLQTRYPTLAAQWYSVYSEFVQRFFFYEKPKETTVKQ